MKINIDCSLILLLLSGMLALLKIGGQFPYSWIWVLAPIWIPLLALAGITIINMDEQAFEIHEGDRIAQIVFLPYAHMQFEPVNELDSTERGDKGFGSSGIN